VPTINRWTQQIVSSPAHRHAASFATIILALMPSPSSSISRVIRNKTWGSLALVDGLQPRIGSGIQENSDAQMTEGNYVRD
jgi:hypothetical protein